LCSDLGFGPRGGWEEISEYVWSEVARRSTWRCRSEVGGQRCSSEVQVGEVLVLHSRKLDEVEEGEKEEEMREEAEEERGGGGRRHGLPRLGFSDALPSFAF
jgi:hypothetical protein